MFPAPHGATLIRLPRSPTKPIGLERQQAYLGFPVTLGGMMFYILICSPDPDANGATGWRVNPESPFPTEDSAIDWAEAECVLPWAVCDGLTNIVAL